MFSACRLDDIVFVVTDKTAFDKDETLPYIGLEHIGQHGVGVTGSSPAAESISTNAIFKRGDVLFGKLRPNLRKSALAPFDGYSSTDVLVLRPKSGIAPRFAAKVFQAERVGAAAEMTAAGTKMPRTSWKDLRALEVYCPDIEGQEAIADVLDTLDTTISQTEAIIEKLQQVKQGLLDDLLTRGISANGELRPPQSQAPHLYKESPLGWIPRDWDIALLGKKAEISGGVTLGRSISGSGVVELPYLRVANVQDGYLDLAEIKRVRVLVSEIPRFKLEYGDVLMNEGGDFDKLGRGAIWSGQIDECLHQNHVFRVRCDQSSLNPHYLTAYSGSAFGRAFFVRASKQTTNLASINSTQLKGFPLRLPPLAEQDEINKRLFAVESRIDAERLACNKLKNQKFGLMDDLLTGRVRVTPLLDTQAPRS